MFGSWFPPPRPRCSPADASVQCDSRRVAQRAGEMLWIDGTMSAPSGWAYPVSHPEWPPRYRWTHCPFCNDPLPGAPYPQADGEDGG